MSNWNGTASEALERLDGKLSRAVLRGLGGSNARPATRLLEKWERRCAYCGALNVPLQMEHIVPKVRGGSNRVSNLTMACKPCNDAKGKRTATAFGHPEVQAQAKRPLKDAAAVNASRWALYRHLLATRLPIEVDPGGRTKWNRTARGLPKTHWLDAACV
jgi:5-methylcytosine-specific restriction endonuclease McrA